MSNKPEPLIPEDLLQQLEDIYRMKTPSPSVGERELWIKVGQAKLVESLRARFEAQQTRRNQ